MTDRSRLESLATAPKERPILFSGPMVRAILDGRKTQTRRVVKCAGLDPHRDRIERWDEDRGAFRPRASDEAVERQFVTTFPLPTRCPYGAPGDRLWVRETWAAFTAPEYWSGESDEITCSPAEMRGDFWHLDRDTSIVFRANGLAAPDRWRPAIHMPRWASRLNLLVTAVRVERLQSITTADIEAEGVLDDAYHDAREHFLAASGGEPAVGPTPRSQWVRVWDAINGKRAPWAANPWVWVVEFRRLGAEAGR
jgi:hypothetical protein